MFGLKPAGWGTAEICLLSDIMLLLEKLVVAEALTHPQIRSD